MTLPSRKPSEQVISAKRQPYSPPRRELGAVVSDRERNGGPLRAYGQSLGMAFQLVDDALDYQASEADLGKAIGDDFRDGKVTLPVIIAYAAATAEGKKFWEAALESGETLSPENLKRAKELLVKHNAFEDNSRSG